MTDEKFEEFLKRSAAGYNAPPARAPREEMWNAIQAARSAGPRVIHGGARALRTTGENRFGSKVWWAAAAAGLVLVATGVGIGRWTASPEPSARNTAGVAPALTKPAPPTDSSPAQFPGTEPTRVAGPGSSAAPARGTERSSAPVGRVASTGGAAPSGSEAPSRSPSSPAATTSRTAPTQAYQLAAVNHLSQAEALLTSFKTRSAADQQVDAQLASWARDLLSNTRLLLDSPLAADPQRRPLLQDLELLLVQIVQLSPGGTPQDRDIINRSLQQDQLLIRLRTAIPAGQQGS